MLHNSFVLSPPPPLPLSAGVVCRWGRVAFFVLGMPVGLPTGVPRGEVVVGVGFAADSRAFSVALRGLAGQIVTVEVGLSAGLPGLHIAGVPDTLSVESCDRVRAATLNSVGGSWPMTAVTVALHPAGLPRPGSVYDLALAAAILAAQDNSRSRGLEKTILLGELALDGRVRPVRGVLPAVLAAKQAGWSAIVVPAENLAEAALVEGMEVWGVRTLGQMIAWLDTGRTLDLGAADPEQDRKVEDPASPPVAAGWTEVGQAVEVAAAGCHHMLLVGQDSSATAAIAHRLVAVLPDLNDEEALEVTALHSVAAMLEAPNPRITRPQLVSPPAASSVGALVGGGSGLARPGAISLAHRGVLFLDDAAEMGVSAMEAIRFPLEDGEVRIARRAGVVCYPARFQLILGTRECGCAAGSQTDCICSAPTRAHYNRRLCGALLDRMDVRVRLSPVSTAKLAAGAGGGGRAASERVAAARLIAMERWGPHGFCRNAEVPGSLLRRKFRPSSAAMEPMRTALELGSISVRGADRCLRVAWTVADLAGRTSPSLADVQAAMSFRQGGVA